MFLTLQIPGVIGKAGVDFPAFPNIPNTGFNCKNVPTGYYADLETDCQVIIRHQPFPLQFKLNKSLKIYKKPNPDQKI